MQTSRFHRSPLYFAVFVSLIFVANVHAGGASMILQPVAPKTQPPSSYPPGTTIVGQEIILGSVPARVWLEVHVTGWAPECLKTVQAKIDATDSSNMDGGGYAGSAADCQGAPGNGGNLSPAQQACNGRCNASSGPLAGSDCLRNSDCGNPPGTGQCQFTSPAAPNGNIVCRRQLAGLATNCKQGEPSTCAGSGGNAGRCDATFQDTCDTEWIGSGLVYFPTVEIETPDPVYGAVVGPDDCLNDFGPSYLGTLVLDVPANAKGTYTIDFVEAESFMQNQGTPPTNVIPAVTFFPARITIACGRCCSAGPLQCVDHVTNADCGASVDQVFTADELCPVNGGPACPECVSDADCNDGNACTIDQCQSDSCQNTPIQLACDDGLFCNGAETCNAAIGCIDGPIPCDPNLCDEAADECRDGIPTVSAWGLAILILALLVAAKLRYRRMTSVTG